MNDVNVFQILKPPIKYKLKHSEVFAYIFLVVGFLNTVLRTSVESDITLFRALIPFAIVALYFLSKTIFKSFLVISISFGCLMVLQCVYYASINDLSIIRVDNLAYMLHYFSIGLVFGIAMALLSNKIQQRNFFKLLYVFFVITILIGVIQHLFGIELPFTLRRGDVIVGFYWTENEYSVAIIAFLPLLLYKLITKFKIHDLLLLVLLSFFVIINDSRIVLMSIPLQILLFIIFMVCYKLTMPQKVIGLIVFLLISVLIIIILYSLDFVVDIGQGISVREDLVQPILRIITLNPYAVPVGSVEVRANATIYGIRELINACFFGIGPGNSIFLMVKCGVAAFGAASMHNFVLHVLVETGIFGIIALIFIIKSIIRKLKTKMASKALIVSMLVFMITFPIFSLSSSSGFFSMFYIFAIVVFYLNIDYSQDLLTSKRDKLLKTKFKEKSYVRESINNRK